jgi:phosphatidylglycerol lysyltransferase
LGRGHHAILAISPAATAALLFVLRRRFTVRSEPQSVRQGLALVAAGLVVAIAYGTFGFWELDRRDFAREFHLVDAWRATLRQYFMAGDPSLTPQTRHARWFLDSLRTLGVCTLGFALLSLYRPITYRMRTLPHERARFATLLDRHGHSSLDWFKLWPDKSYWFGPGQRSGIAYRAAWGVAVALGDPVGAPEDLEACVHGFARWCTDNGWRIAFHQAGPELLPLYRRAGLQAVKIGEEPYVDLQVFAAQTQHSNVFRRVRNRARSLGWQVTWHDAPHSGPLLDEVEAISDDWLSLPGRRERRFTLGHFDRGMLGQTQLVVIREAGGRALAFTNLIPCWPAGDSTTDLMRHRVEVPNGCMDHLFVELLVRLSATHRRFSLGLAPLAGVGDRPGAPLEERALFQISERLNRFFSYKGLRSYKAKFQPHWENRFLVYQGGPPGLVATGLAFTRITEA